MELKTYQTINLSFALFTVLVFLLFIFRIIDTGAFWSGLVIAAIYVYIVMPRLRKKVKGFK
jgi:hypothetical protein